MSEEIDVLKIVTGRLERVGIGYMVTGSMALDYYALPRMTRDIDLVVELSPQDAERIVDLFREDFYVDGAAVRQAIERREAFNVIEMPAWSRRTSSGDRPLGDPGCGTSITHTSRNGSRTSASTRCTVR
jgi:hypothetical protein